VGEKSRLRVLEATGDSARYGGVDDSVGGYEAIVSGIASERAAACSALSGASLE
jgi:hypothetical protein